MIGPDPSKVAQETAGYLTLAEHCSAVELKHLKAYVPCFVLIES